MAIASMVALLVGACTDSEQSQNGNQSEGVPAVQGGDAPDKPNLTLNASVEEMEHNSGAGGLMPSFECASASTQNEKLICSAANLAARDAAMSLLFKSSQRTDDVRKEQKEWLFERNKCRDAACLVESYDGRLADLSYVTFAPKLRRGDGEGILQMRPLGDRWFLFSVQATWNRSHTGEAAGVVTITDGRGLWRASEECALAFERIKDGWIVRSSGDCTELGGLNVELDGRYTG